MDLIIINEVKVLLVSKGLVNLGLSNISSQDAQVIVESINYLGDSDISLSDIELSPTQASDVLDQTENEELTTFMNNLPGGKSLRNKVRKKMAEKKQKLAQDLKSTDSNSTYTNNIIKT